MRALRLLGREVRGGAHHRPGLREVALGRSVHRTRDTEVGNLHLTAGSDEDVGRLDVAVHHTVAMREPERCRNLAGDLGRLMRVHVAVGAQDVGERATLHVLHRHEVRVRVLTPVVHADNVRVVEVGGRLRFTAETLDEVRVDRELGEQHLDRNGPVEQEIAREEHVGHAAAPDALLNLVAVVEYRPLWLTGHCCLSWPNR